MPPESRRTKAGFVAVGAFSVLCIIGAGINNSISQNRLTQTISVMADNVQKLAAPANVQKNSSVDEILAAAAAKLLQQDRQIERLEKETGPITHPEDGLYIKDVLIGIAQGE